MKTFALGMLVFAMIFSIYANQDVFAHHVIEEIPTSSSPMGMAFGEDTLYVSSLGYPHIDIIDVTTQENIGFITTSTSGIMDVEVVPDKNKIYAAPFGSGGIDVYTLSTRQIIKTIPLPSSEFIIQSTTNQPYGQMSNIHFVTGGWSMDYNPSKELLYVVDYVSHLIYVINGKTDELVETIDVPRHPFTVRADPITNTVMVASLAGNEITFLEDTTGKFSVKSIHEIKKTLKVSGGPWGLEIDSEAGLAYVTNRGCECITVIDIVNKEIINEIPIGDKAQAIAVDPSENQIYVSYLKQNKIVKIDGETNKIVLTHELESNPWDIEVNPKNHQVYAALKAEDEILVLGPQSKSINIPVVTLQSPSMYVGMVYIHGQDVDSSGAILDVDNFTLTLAIESEDGGQIAIGIPREVLDSKQGDIDFPLEVRIDDNVIKHTESDVDANLRLISIMVPKGAETITIMGDRAIQAMPKVEKIPEPSPVPIPPEKIICEGKVWIESVKGRIACVTPSTADKLVERGWGTILGQ